MGAAQDQDLGLGIGGPLLQKGKAHVIAPVPGDQAGKKSECKRASAGGRPLTKDPSVKNRRPILPESLDKCNKKYGRILSKKKNYEKRTKNC